VREQDSSPTAYTEVSRGSRGCSGKRKGKETHNKGKEHEASALEKQGKEKSRKGKKREKMRKGGIKSISHHLAVTDVKQSFWRTKGKRGRFGKIAHLGSGFLACQKEKIPKGKGRRTGAISRGWGVKSKCLGRGVQGKGYGKKNTVKQLPWEG